mmetsp:Transcript_19330/g.28180  ORF Transcript_19330/g.28180 Transcript_19330/m.28180 type:complete len:168 (+) Transcript_19330:151-654(+)
MTVIDEDNASHTPRGALSFLFRSCSGDPKGSVHRAWSVTLLFTLLFFVIAIVEVLNLNSSEASTALTAAAVWTTVIQFGMIIVGTFIIKRFTTPFSVGFLLGLVIVVAQQYLLLSVTFWNHKYGSAAKNYTFANLAFSLFFLYSIFAAVLGQFRESVMVDVQVTDEG